MDRRLIKQIAETIRQADRHKTHAYDTAATVVRVEGGTAWVHIPGGVDETPVKLTVDAKKGDTVQVRVSGGRAFLVGNATAPPTDDTTANKVGTSLTAMQKVVKGVKDTAEKAKRIATSTAQYFWVSTGGNDNGAHVTAIPQEQFEADPQNGGGNTLMTSNGVAVREGLTELATFATDGIELGDEHGKHVAIKYDNETAQTSIISDILLAVVAQNEPSTPEGSTTESGGCSARYGASVVRHEQTSTMHECLGWVDTSAGYANVPNVREEGIGRARLVAGSINKTASIEAVADDSEDLSRIGVFTDNFTFTKNEVDYYPAIVKDTFSATGLSASTYYLEHSFPITKTGYTPIALNVRTNQAALLAHKAEFDGRVMVAHRSANAISNLNLYLDVTYARNELL